MGGVPRLKSGAPQRRHACARCWPALTPLPFGSPGRSHRPDLHNPIDLCQGALPLGHVFVEASTTRGHDEFWRNAVPDSCVPEKWYSFPLLIPQPDWDKYHFSGLSHI
jgi:hypothetical protein